MADQLYLTQLLTVLELKSKTDDKHLHLTQLAPSTAASGAASDHQGIASTDILAHRLLRISPSGLDYLDADNPNHSGLCVGISLTAASPNGAVRYRNIGTIKNDGWSFPVGAILYAGQGGVLSTQAGQGFAQQIGVSISPTEVQLNIGMAIIRAD